MSHMTKLPGVADRDVVKPGMAHFAGTGPPGMTCGRCIHRGYRRHTDTRSYSTGACAMFLKLATKNGPSVNKQWAACRYFERKPDDDRR